MLHKKSNPLPQHYFNVKWYLTSCIFCDFIKFYVTHITCKTKNKQVVKISATKIEYI